MFKRRKQCENCQCYIYNVPDDIRDNMETECTHEFNMDTDEICPIFQRQDFWVNVYLIDRAYGGPEEGGWWFDYGLPEMGILCINTDEAEEIKSQMQEVVDMWNEGRRPIHSVLSEGEYRVFIETHKPEEWPEIKPYYE